MSNEHLRQLSNEISNTRNSIREIEVQLTNLILNDIKDVRRKRILKMRQTGLKIHLRNLENKIISLLN